MVMIDIIPSNLNVYVLVKLRFKILTDSGMLEKANLLWDLLIAFVDKSLYNCICLKTVAMTKFGLSTVLCVVLMQFNSRWELRHPGLAVGAGRAVI
jgi:hypothetical protein